jgi:hypothetical protein
MNDSPADEPLGTDVEPADEASLVPNSPLHSLTLRAGKMNDLSQTEVDAVFARLRSRRLPGR